MLEMRNQYDFFLNTTLNIYHIFTLGTKKRAKPSFETKVVVNQRSTDFNGGETARAWRQVFYRFGRRKWW